MINNPAEPIRSQFDLIYRSIRANTTDVTDEEALITPESGGNCINWMLGHILLNRNDLFSLLNRRPAVDSDKYRIYKRGGKGELEAWSVIQLSELKLELEHSQKMLTDALSSSHPEDEKLKRIAQMAFHEAYHAGQIGLMRRIIGKSGAIS